MKIDIFVIIALLPKFYKSIIENFAISVRKFVEKLSSLKYYKEFDIKIFIA